MDKDLMEELGLMATDSQLDYICGRYWRPRGSIDRAFRLQGSYLKI